MLLEKSGEIAKEGMKRLSHSGNNTLLSMCLVVKVKSDAVKNKKEEESSKGKNPLEEME